jgi:hypothetical protein
MVKTVPSLHIGDLKLVIKLFQSHLLPVAFPTQTFSFLNIEKMSKLPLAGIKAVDADASSIAPEKTKSKWRGYIWDSFDKSPEERCFIFKLDLALLTFGCLGISPPGFGQGKAD